MYKMIILLAIAIAATSSAFAAEETNVMATVNQFVDGFNKGDFKSASAACTDQMSIIDEFSPHEWHGAGAFSRWVDDFDADARKNEITDGFVTLRKPRHIDVTADHAYVVIPANYAFKKQGKPAMETGSIITIVLQKDPAGWRITAWAWAKN
jgi:ketosteroid isomerase-like protein